jgi:lysophospholipase L1-like esterase
VQSWLRRGGSLTPYWDDDACRRSARGAPALAARALEAASDRTSVTLVYLACSGASVDAGILGAQSSAGLQASQIEQAVQLLGDRPVDLVLLSIGGNDVGFTSVLESCALSTACPISRPRPGPLSGSPTVNAGVQARTAELAGDLDRIAACLGTGPCVLAGGRASAGVTLSADARILPTLYPDITRDAAGAPCTYLTIPSQDFAWARSTILSPAPPARYPYPVSTSRTVDLSVASGSLNQQLAAASRLAGWSPVVGTWSASGDSPVGHGVCAGDDAWVFGLTALSALPSASFHPNPAGQAVLATAIVNAVRGLSAD